MKRPLLILFGFTVLAAGLLASPAPRAAAAPPCADVEVVFARGTVETAPPVGVTGLSFEQALRNQLPGKSVNVYGVNYPAGSNFDNRMAFVQGVVKGVNDTQRRVKYLAAQCPGSHIVVGGYSQGAVVASYALSNKIQIDPQYRQYQDRVPQPLADNAASHVTAAILFAPPSSNWIKQVGAPPMNVGPLYEGKTKRYCIAGDVVCDGAPVGQPNGLHVLYAVNGMTVDAAQYVRARL
ncbi:cutinase family protein [Gordonia sp. i37]|uniref:cutinase family protein n=1 Tax=Gordonia sp. i37 TaxID=1961707 RepID=UPI0009AD0C91|nr:cutinase family protein [Gordonia sp. i37]OPX08292.1 cutinase [Gordonia sp. i37]